MKTSLLLTAAFAGLSLAQLTGLPECAQKCATIFLSGGIGNCGRDPECICADTSFIGAISCCLVGACAADDQQKAIDFAQQICQANKVSVPNTVLCTSSTTSSGAGPAQTTSSSTSPATNSASPTGTAATASTTGGAATTTSRVSTSSSASAAGQTTAASSAASKNAGPRGTAAPVMGALGGLVAFAALL